MATFSIRDEFLPFCLPDVSEAEVREIEDTIRSGWWAKGSRSIAFEEHFARYVGAKHAVSLNSCTAALHLALLCAGIGPGDEVITTPLTFVSSVNTILHVGATPIFVDVLPDSGVMDPSAVSAAITPRTKALVPVHYAGYPCDLESLYAIAQKHGLFVSEDAAHAVETKHRGKLIGNRVPGTASFSFYATKNLATGEGGMLITEDEQLAQRARVFSCHGMSSTSWNRYGKGGKWYYDVEEFGFKYNMFDIQAALGLVQLKRLPDMQRRRMEAVQLYQKAFSQMPEVQLHPQPGYGQHSWHLFVLRLTPGALRIGRDAFIEELNARNIGVSVHFVPVHQMSVYKNKFGYQTGAYPNAEAFFEQAISLPMYATLGTENAQYVVDAVADIIAKHRA